jgi:hypothetical protein
MLRLPCSAEETLTAPSGSGQALSASTRENLAKRETLAVQRRGRYRGACGALTGRGNHLPGGIRRHVQGPGVSEELLRAKSTIWNLRPYNPR